jgi:hypothetical protein
MREKDAEKGEKVFLRWLLLLAGLFFLFNSCKKENRCDCLKSRGETVLESRSLADFSTLRVYDKIDVYFTQDTTLTAPVVQVKTGKNLVPNISTRVEGGELSIENRNKCNFVRGEHNDVTVYITAPYVKYFVQEGVGSIFGTNTVTQDSVDCTIKNSGDIRLAVNTRNVTGHMHGIGDLYLEGLANSFFTHTVGQGFINAEGFRVGYAFVVFKSNGLAHVNVTGQLDGMVASTGDLYYTGNPAVVNVEVTGKGKLIRY